MNSVLQAHITFHLRGLHAASPLEPVDLSEVRPALLSRYETLADLRYDYPLVFFEDGEVQALSAVMDGVLRDIAGGDDGARVSQHVLRLERRIRQLVAQGAGGSLSGLWTLAALELTADGDEGLIDSLDRARAALARDGEVVDCDARAPGRLVGHLWRAAQASKAERVRQDIGVLTHRLSDILRAEQAASVVGRSPERLRAAMGPAGDETFDFDVMARLLQEGAPPVMLTDRRRGRIEATLELLRQQRFFPAVPEDGYAFAFTSAVDALNAYWVRHAELTELLSAIETARLEVDGACDDAPHEIVFETRGRARLDGELSSLTPEYLVAIDADALDRAEHAALLEILSAGLPMKVLVQTHDVLDAPSLGPTHFGFGFTSRQLVNTAIGLNDIFVCQTPASHLLKQIDAIRHGFRYTGPALISVFTGDGGHTGELPPYLVAAAALEARAFPAFIYDPSAGPDWASRFSIAGNPSADADWPTRRFTYETAAHQAAASDLEFTFADFVACDARYGGHFAKVDRSNWHDRLIPVSEALSQKAPGWDRVPALMVVSRDHRLGKLLVDDRLLRQTSRCLAMWHSLQELGGVNNSHARRAAEQARQAQGAAHSASTEPAGLVDAATPEPAASTPAAAPERDPHQPFIETPRCSTCNECVQLNPRMFAYNDNRQAYIADPAAGTYRQLVEAAESCQVSIIHPGEPTNPNEPGLDELIERAKLFQ